MSHLTSYNSKVLENTKKSLLNKAAQDLGLEIDYNIKVVKNVWITEKVDAGFVKDGKPLTVGLRFEEIGKKTKTHIAGDFFGQGLDERSFINRFSQAYKKQDVIKQCKNQGWNISSKDITLDKETNEIVIQASRIVV